MTPQERKIMQQALDALKMATCQGWHDMLLTGAECSQMERASSALRQALEAPEAEPAAPEDTVSNRRHIADHPGSAIALMQGFQRRIAELKAQLAAPQPAPAMPASEPVTPMDVVDACHIAGVETTATGIAGMRRALEGFAAGRAIGTNVPVIQANKPRLSLQGQVLEGWQLVPVEPTDDMRKAAYAWTDAASSTYHAMLASAPKPPAKPEQCWCDAQGIGESGMSCGDCPRDYAPQASDLHDEIMNLRCLTPDDMGINQLLAFRPGHKAARHAAAELALPKLPADKGAAQ